MSRYSPRRLGLLVLGCVVLGLGVGLLLTADLGSDGYSTLVNGIHRKAGIPFVVANTGVGIVFLAAAAMRRLFPDVGTVVQVVLVGLVVGFVLDALATPASELARTAYLLAALPILAVGVALYLGSRLGAGPAEAAALAWDPPVPFRWNYSVMQGAGALVGWLLGAAIGPGTVAVIVLLGPAVDLIARTLRLDISPVRT
ncbi:MAG: hypothetical protein JWP74_2531 [Marmoricola sp.]|nr:hypothetical protein [Marmoricola sp.]